MISKLSIVILVVIFFNGLIGFIESATWPHNNKYNVIQPHLPQQQQFQIKPQLPPNFVYSNQASVPQSASTITNQRFVLFPASNSNSNNKIFQRISPKINLKPANNLNNNNRKLVTTKPNFEQWNHTYRKATTNTASQLNPLQTEQEDAPGAYTWGYKWLDEFGNQMFREESNDGRGTVRGRYSFRESSGIIRIVEYIADHLGYRTRIRTNEPGMVSSNPAGAEIIKFEGENIPAK